MMYIGIDGGGTKTKFSLFNDTLQEVDTCTLPTSHFAQVGYDGCRKVLQEGMAILKKRHGLHEYVIGYGLAGYGQEHQVRKALEYVVKEISENHPYHLVSDVESALAGAFALQDGILLLAGTGSIAIAKKGNTMLRCGGWGWEIGDEGSAGWMGRKVLEVFTKQADGRLPKGALYDILMHECHLQHDYDMISYVRNHLCGDRSKIARFAQFAQQAALAEDEQAKGIYEAAAKELSLHVHALCRQLSITTRIPVAYMGGVFTKDSMIFQYLDTYLPHQVQVCPPMYGPEVGAVLLAIAGKGK